MSHRLQQFEAALSEKFPDMTLEELSASLRVDLETLKNHISQGTKIGAMADSVLPGLLGASLEEFIGQDQATAGAAQAASDIEPLLAKARRVLEAGGDNAVTLRTILNSIKA